MDAALIDGLAQRFPGCQQVLLAEEVIQVGRPHAIGKRARQVITRLYGLFLSK
jgi:hypothetical protein